MSIFSATTRSGEFFFHVQRDRTTVVEISNNAVLFNQFKNRMTKKQIDDQFNLQGEPFKLISLLEFEEALDKIKNAFPEERQITEDRPAFLDA